MPKLSNRLAHLEALKKAKDDAPRYYLNFAGRDCPRVRANGILLERRPDETPDEFQVRIEAQRNGAHFLMVNAALTEEEWVADVAEHYRKHPVGQPWQE
ncbi:MAG: hypothetical protein ACP59X_19065 [Solidesulfovibrio sp. DCME]|uniref:hypothetical protein n=1 Tax=Solidesulfovibrio sp. DCME TaxID=3447380 RepID=UPI003D119A7D